MTKIVKHNEFEKIFKCSTCKCEFTANISDVYNNHGDHWIVCPQCSNNIEVNFYDDGTFDYWKNVKAVQDKKYREKLWQIDEEKRQEKENIIKEQVRHKEELKKLKEEEEEKKREERNAKKMLVPVWRRLLGLY